MKKVILFGEKSKEISKLLEKYKFDVLKEEDKRKAEAIIAYGGDGTLMLSEFKYPGIPKVLLKGSRICKKCEKLTNEEILKRVKEEKYKVVKLWKIEGISLKGRILGMNDIIIHNADVRHAVRMNVFVDNINIAEEEIIGDGVIISTPFGSSGYYRSITKSVFDVGIGFAFNNSTEPIDHMVLDERKKIKVFITRGPAVVYADNIPQSFVLENEDWIEVKKSRKFAKLIRVA
jgi:NAD+ kinase